MKKLVFSFALLFASCHDHGVHAAPLAQAAEAAKLAGKWQLTIDTPHGPMKGPFQRRIERQIPRAQLFVDDGTNLPRPGIGGEDRPLVANLS